jgi:DNA-binding XRE family transcriptional regulator
MARKNFITAKKHTVLTTGETIRMLRELKEWTQEELAERSGINSKNMSICNGLCNYGLRPYAQAITASKNNAFCTVPSCILLGAIGL